ncbi:hypothetical protein CPLU01_15337 [Colletotrichum plurivorum]|uniref:Uncharacterized protein n=1 Tax=Colletotrichum plurivorum TaxID=2175906 RepID=A0A8H6JBZ3_9PEZI|nr:hypothetical protein CPLU01_15337 [Colletotrichum plurivorum]
MQPSRLAIRRIAATRAVVPRVVAAGRQVRSVTNKPDDGDLGGPGGQEPVPSNSGFSQSWPTLAAIGGVGLLVGGYLVHLTGRPRGQVKPGEFDQLAEKVVPRK